MSETACSVAKGSGHSGRMWGGGEMISQHDGLADLSMNGDEAEWCRDMIVEVQW
jgi:hypothetical protein